MVRILLALTLVALLNILAGCFETPAEKTHFIPPAETQSTMTSTSSLVEPGEIDIVEQLAANRWAYRQALELLVDYYSGTGNYMKLTWARRELDGLTAIPRYRYLLEAEIAGPNLRAAASIPQADDLYDDAMFAYKKARGLLIFVDEKQLGIALDKFNQLIARYPSSDKIDDAAYKAGQIYQHLKDYAIAAIYYNRAHQWDPRTPYPARFKAAYILDKYLMQRAEALSLYRQYLDREVERHPQYGLFVERRIDELSGALQAEE
jgi:tetratricopeptide (TPR) repeat protein